MTTISSGPDNIGGVGSGGFCINDWSPPPEGTGVVVNDLQELDVRPVMLKLVLGDAPKLISSIRSTEEKFAIAWEEFGEARTNIGVQA